MLSCPFVRNAVPGILFVLAQLGAPAGAATESVLHSFSNQKDAYPQSRLLLSNGALFGTVIGIRGSNNCCGEVFQVAQSRGAWKFHRVLKFNHTNRTFGRYPQSGLIQDSGGNLYGSTYFGGNDRVGTIFELQKSGASWTPILIRKFSTKNPGHGEYPSGDLVIDGNGSLYGTTQGGGKHGFGVVYELSQSGGKWTEIVVYSFKGGRDGEDPFAGLYMDAAGSLWGTTEGGGGSCECGTVFHLTQSSGVWTETVIHRFGKDRDGADPLGNLIEDPDGNFYGTTDDGGAHGLGTVFEISPLGGGWTEKVLYDFCSLKNCRDGEDPVAGLTWGSNFNTIFGTTTGGGSVGAGTVFSLTNSGGTWNEAIVYSFEGRPNDGALPEAAVILDQSGNLYGTTAGGGPFGLGTVWEVTP